MNKLSDIKVKEKNSTVLSIKLDFRIDVKALVNDEDSELVTFTFLEEDIINGVREAIKKDCFCRVENRSQIAKDG